MYPYDKVQERQVAISSPTGSAVSFQNTVSVSHSRSRSHSNPSNHSVSPTLVQKVSPGYNQLHRSGSFNSESSSHVSNAKSLLTSSVASSNRKHHQKLRL